MKPPQSSRYLREIFAFIAHHLPIEAWGSGRSSAQLTGRPVLDCGIGVAPKLMMTYRLVYLLVCSAGLCGQCNWGKTVFAVGAKSNECARRDFCWLAGRRFVFIYSSKCDGLLVSSLRLSSVSNARKSLKFSGIFGSIRDCSRNKGEGMLHKFNNHKSF